ncbi:MULTISPECIES: barstar family protein [Kitasatospora]|uniref:RNAse (Barnase) inhibitor barstar n=2 Tax=Kitasatospora TaxID=2063 RepID=A0ABT1IZK1_9ACTN|nr:barstar family protein [Kitasatospora paracochleata]MCP2310598.1 RNAse (barnase) inhibitor barstar [Kitasatospora paracochleata]
MTAAPPPDAPEAEYHLRGELVTDEPSFYAQLGRLLDAPGGYYGSNLDALADCLRGGFGPEPPFTLVWHESAASARVLTRPLPGGDGVPRSYFDAIVDVLRQGGVTVKLR